MRKSESKNDYSAVNLYLQLDDSTLSAAGLILSPRKTLPHSRTTAAHRAAEEQYRIRLPQQTDSFEDSRNVLAA